MINSSYCCKMLIVGTFDVHTDWNHPPWPGIILTICMCCFMTGGPDKEQGTNKPPPTRRVKERSKGDTTCPTTSQNPSHWYLSLLSKLRAIRKGSESEWLAKDNPETNPIIIKPKTGSHMAEQVSWVPLPYCSPPGWPFPIQSLALSAHVYLQTIHFWVLDKSPLLGPGRGPPFCNSVTYEIHLYYLYNFSIHLNFFKNEILFLKILLVMCSM